MATVVPFRGILYNQDKVSGDEVIAPPYDIITSEYREALYQKSPYNIVRIDFGKEMPGDSDGSDRYSRSGGYLGEWLKEGVLVRDDRPCFYACEIDYTLSGEAKRLRGILALVKIEELGKGVFPHEATHSKPKADRLDLMRACHANISPIYSLYNSPERTASRILDGLDEKPCIAARDSDGALHKLYRISDEARIELIKRELCDKPIFIADGHHRYEVALEFRKEMGGGGPEPKPWDYVLMFLANMADEGITILPTHRMVRGVPSADILRRLGDDFVITRRDMVPDIAGALSREGKSSFGLYIDGERQWYALKYKGNGLKDLQPALRDLDVVVLHELILRHDLGVTDVAYEMDASESMKKVAGGEFDAVFFLNPTCVGDVEKVALAGLRMPPKSTYFYPKLLTGMVINKF